MNLQVPLRPILISGTGGFVVAHSWALAGAVWHYVIACARTGRRPTPVGLARHLVPPGFATSRWTRIDVTLFAIHRSFQFLVLPLVLAATLAVAAAATHLLGLLHRGGMLRPGFWTTAPFLLAGLIARDFASLAMHALQHKIPLLWAFHKVHHAPPTLVPATARRLHPLDELCGILTEALLFGTVIGTQAWATGQLPPTLIGQAVTLYVLVNMLLFSPLRHSHIDLRLGWLEHVVFSPAHHQIHHSVEPPHWDCNFGSILSWWDRLWGTFGVSESQSSYRLGLPDRESEAYASIMGCYLMPVRQAWSLFRAPPER